MTDTRKAAFAAHDSARDVRDAAAQAVARAAGHATATSHVHTHAQYAAHYAAKSEGKAILVAAGTKAADLALSHERHWQREQLPEKLAAAVGPA